MTMTGQEALQRIRDASTPTDLFGTGPERQQRRMFRVLASIVHPDRAVLEGIAPEDAAAATVRLNDLFAQLDSAPTATTAPHVIGSHGTYLLRDRCAATAAVATYLTDQDRTRVFIARNPAHNGQVTALDTAAGKLAEVGMQAFVPEVVDRGTTDGRTWTAYRLPGGAVSLRDVRDAYPQGLDGRDWAWMARRILMTLDAAGTSSALDLDTVFVVPEAHGVILTAFTAEPRLGRNLGILFDAMLDHRPDAQRQAQLARSLDGMSASTALREYDLLLTALYGDRRFRPFSIPSRASNTSRGAAHQAG